MTVRNIVALSCSADIAARLFPTEFRDLRRWFIPDQSVIVVPPDVEGVLAVVPQGNGSAFMVWVDPDARRRE